MVSNFAPSTRQIVRLALVVTIGVAAIASAKAGIRYTSEQQSACMPDAFRLCASEIPNVSRIRTCMIAHKTSLSPECRAMFRS